MDHIKRAIDRILTSQGNDVPDFVWNILELKNVNASTINVYYDFLRDHHHAVEGDIVEYGVYRGASLISTALLLKAWGSKKKVYGFDSFSGFPPPHANDDKARFKDLLDKGQIDREHYEWTQFKIECEKLWPREHSFDKTSLDFVNRRIDLFKLDNVVIVEGNLSHNTGKLPAKIMACLYDCDLYEPYALTLPEVWKRTEKHGMLYFDEYYSLKYPGPRIAVDDFCKQQGIKPIKCSRESKLAFERWYLQK
jgi:hypothetical protein